MHSQELPQLQVLQLQMVVLTIKLPHHQQLLLQEVEEVEQQQLRRLAAQVSLTGLLLLLVGQVTHLLLLSPLIIHLRTIEQKSSLGIVQPDRSKSSIGQEPLALLKSLLD